MSEKRLFISHSSADKELAGALVNLIETGIGLSSDDIFCSSLEGLGVNSGLDFVSDIKAEIQKPEAVLLLVSSNYLSSRFCMFELGAAWAMSHNILPILVPPVTYSDLPSVMSHIQSDIVDTKGHLNRFASQLLEYMKIKPRLERWETERDLFLKRLPEITEKTTNQTVIPSERFVFRKELIRDLPWARVSEETKDTLWIWAWSGVAALNERTRNTLISLLKRKKKIKFMILNPDVSKRAAVAMKMSPVCSWPSEKVQKDITRGREALIDLWSGLDKNQREYFFIRETDWFMAWSGLAIDPETECGRLQIENYLYNYGEHVPSGNHLDYRPNLLLTKQSKFYTPYWRSIEEMWEKAKPITVGVSHNQSLNPTA